MKKCCFKYWECFFLQPDYYRDATHFHRVDQGPEYRLEIPNAKLDFTGTYTVYAKNCHGDAKAIISLQIKAKEKSTAPDTMDHTKISDFQTMPSIKRELQFMKCCDGDSVVFECEIDGVPTPDVRWERGGKLVHLGGDFHADLEGTIARLSIKQVYPEDEGEYTCVAFNDLGKASTSACLIVNIPEEKATTLCQQLQRPSGHSLEPSPLSTPRTTPTRSLSPRIRQRERTSSIGAHRRVRATIPKFYTIPHNRVAEEGETVKFQCAVAGFPDPYTNWEKDGVILSSSDRLTISEVDDLRVLELKDVGRQDSGTYKIILENEVGRVEASARLDVVCHRNYHAISSSTRARSLSPRISSGGRRLAGSSALLGSRTRLHCDIRTVPTPFLKWYRDGIPIEQSKKFQLSQDENNAYLDIIEVTKEDAGVYNCVAESRTISLEATTYLEVFEEVRVIEDLPENISATENNPVKLRLKVNVVGDFEVIWMKDGCVLSKSDKFRQLCSENGDLELQIRNCTLMDAGNYRCEIYTRFGEITSKTKLCIEGE
ncbi:hypothetical protein WA026_018446 [Henosepilachna vigintioctopunctata]|uniref:Ig-like domain-containing protein n=1 Tax=Henosepilachna vigintioctopunctata TaxID=420089 RepID=A0AAW1V0X8_9CUCU